LKDALHPVAGAPGADLEHAAFGRHRERRSRVAIQPFLAAVAGLTAGLLRFTRNDALKLRFRLNTACL